MRYSPFKKELADIGTEDLASLREVSEGWFVDYKRNIPNARAIAKSIAAFANTRGGWVLYGIDAPSGSDGTPTDFPGILNSEVGLGISKIQNAVSAHLSPAPNFEVRPVLTGGPDSSSDRSIIIVRVPQGPKCPYVHSNGVVFVRVGEKSDPVPLSDRSRLEELFDRLQAATGELQKFLDRPAVGRDEQTFVEVFLLPDPYDIHGWRHNISFERFSELMNPPNDPAHESQLLGFALPFAFSQTMQGAFIARQPGGMTWRFSRSGRHVVTMQLPVESIIHPLKLRSFLDGYNHAVEYGQLWDSTGQGYGRVVDLTMLGVFMFSVAKHVERLRQECAFDGYEGDLHCMVKLRNPGTARLFIDIPHFIQHARSYGIPMTLEGDCAIPSGSADDLALFTGSKSDKDPAIGLGAQLLLMVAGAVGLPWSEHLYRRIADEELRAQQLGEVTAEWIVAIRRALDVQERRKKKHK